MEPAVQGNYKQLAEEIGAVLQAAAETADKMQEDARLEAARLRGAAEAELRTACAEGRRILDEARTEADLVRAEAEWQSQEMIAQARRQVAERLAGADARMSAVEKAQSRVMDRLAGVGQVLADALAALREGPAVGAAQTDGSDDAPSDDDADHPTAKVFFVEFPPGRVPLAPADAGPEPETETETETEIVLDETPGASLFVNDDERSEWAPPSDLPAWWTRGGAQG